MKQNHKFWKIAVAVIVMLFVSSSAAQAIFAITTSNQPVAEFKNSVSVLFNPMATQGGSSLAWEDDFLDESRIDIDKSFNYDADKTLGKVFMKDTYAAWYNSAWKRMKSIDVYNGGSTSL